MKATLGITLHVLTLRLQSDDANDVDTDSGALLQVGV